MAKQTIRGGRAGSRSSHPVLDAAAALLVCCLGGISQGASAAMPALPSPAKIGSGTDVAVVVGAEEYPQIPNVPYATADSDAFYTWLRESGVADPANIFLLQQFKSNRDEMEKALSAAVRQAEKTPGARVWFYFAGHGIADPNSGERLLVGWDAGPDTFVQRSIGVNRLRELAGDVPLTLVVDACFGGQGRDGSDITGGKRFMMPVDQLAKKDAGEKFEAWYSVEGGQFSSPLEGAGHGAFTYFLVGGLSGWADGDADGKVGSDELRGFVASSLQQMQIRDQTPTFQGGNRTVVEGVRSSAPSFDPREAKKAPAVASGGGGGVLDAAISQLERNLAAAQEGSDEKRFLQAKLLRSKASKDWARVASVASTPGPDSAKALSLFIDQYKGATVGDGTHRIALAIAEVAMAETMLEAAKNAGPAVASDGSDPRARAAAMAKDPAWASTLRMESPDVLFPGSGLGALAVGSSVTIADLPYSNCLASGPTLKAKPCSAVKPSHVAKIAVLKIDRIVDGKGQSVSVAVSAGRLTKVAVRGYGATPDGVVVAKSTVEDVIAAYGKPDRAEESRVGMTGYWNELGLRIQFKGREVFVVEATPPK